MKKIGILTCLNSNDVCTRAGCLSAFRERRDFFSGYPEDTILAAVMTCNGCKETNAKEPAEDEGILEKADRLVSEKISVIHVGVCRLNEEKKGMSADNTDLRSDRRTRDQSDPRNP